MSMITDLIANSDAILGIRQALGAEKHTAYLLTRTWAGGEIGEGAPTDAIEAITPAPNLQEYPHDIAERTGGKIEQGTIKLKMVSKKNYTREVLNLENPTRNKGLEKFYYINEKLYTVIGISEYQIHWNVTLKKSSNKKVYLP